MIVTSLCVGHHVTGLKVGAKNARRYFPRGAREIELRLDHLCIECALAPDFWQDQAEIHDPRLCLWLESKQWIERANGPAPVAMIRSGKNSFTLIPFDKSMRKRSGDNKEIRHEDQYVEIRARDSRERGAD
jgi:hypothetical protein